MLAVPRPPMQQLPVDRLIALCREQPDAVLLDVREPGECALAPLALDGVSTVFMPMAELPARLGELDAGRPLVCVCHHGVRSLQVAAYLERAGFDAVHNLAGGVDAWSREVDSAVPRY